MNIKGQTENLPMKKYDINLKDDTVNRYKISYKQQKLLQNRINFTKFTAIVADKFQNELIVT